jgi:hypothetical protein
MATWFIAALPHIPDVIKLAKPLFTRSKPQDKVADVVNTQIVELQNVAAQNADAIQALATEMQKTIDALQIGADALAKQLSQARLLSTAAITASLLSFALAAYALGNGA